MVSGTACNDIDLVECLDVFVGEICCSKVDLVRLAVGYDNRA